MHNYGVVSIALLIFCRQDKVSVSFSAALRTDNSKTVGCLNIEIQIKRKPLAFQLICCDVTPATAEYLVILEKYGLLFEFAFSLTS